MVKRAKLCDEQRCPCALIMRTLHSLSAISLISLSPQPQHSFKRRAFFLHLYSVSPLWSQNEETRTPSERKRLLFRIRVRLLLPGSWENSAHLFVCLSSLRPQLFLLLVSCPCECETLATKREGKDVVSAVASFTSSMSSRSSRSNPICLIFSCLKSA